MTHLPVRLLLALLIAGSPLLEPLAAGVIFSTNVPPVGDGVQNLIGATASANNVKVQYANSCYLAGDNNGVLGQTFITGSNSGGYQLTAISVQQASYDTWWWSGGTIGLRVFKTSESASSGVQSMTVMMADTATIPTASNNAQRGVPGTNAFWMTLTLDQNAPLHLQPNTQYGFDLQAAGTGTTGPFFMEWNGTNADVFNGGQALINGTPSAPAPSTLWLGRGPSDGDRVFVAAMTALGPPWLQIEAQAGTFTLTLNANPGKWYWVQYSDSLQPAVWQNVSSSPVYAHNPYIRVEGLDGGTAQRFFRLQEVESDFAAAASVTGVAGISYLNQSAAETNTFAAQFIAPGKRLGHAKLKYRPAGNTNWFAVDTTALSGVAASSYQTSASTDGVRHVYRYEITNGLSGKMVLESVFELRQGTIHWNLNLTNLSAQSVTIGDWALPLPMNTEYSTASSSVFKHSFISGHGSWIYWMRVDSVGPYLTMTPVGNTRLEYWEKPRSSSIYQAYIHSSVGAANASALGSEWRQPNTSLTLPSGGGEVYGFKFQWAQDYEAVRQILVNEGLINVHVAPGMTVPTNLVAQFALRTTQTVHSVQAEFPAQTQIQFLGTRAGYQLYQARFGKLGENRLTVNYGNNRQMFLEFFVTEPLETLIRKRAQFLVSKQIVNPNKWYDGLYPEWNMASQTLVTPDNYDLLTGFVRYVVAADDAGLSRPAFLALKNVSMPVQTEVTSLDRYIQNFVWGGLQRTTSETYSYGIYGVRDWYVNRNSSDLGHNGQLHLWRTYDYPHIITLYEGMYRIAKLHPHITTALSAKEYLKRAHGTAMALFTVPLQVWNDPLWIPYHRGYMNESVLPNLIEQLETEGLSVEAANLRAHWEQKVNYFVLGGADLFASEYSFDSTGFESQQALARYAMENASSFNATNPAAYRQAALQFMGEVNTANTCLRGWLESAYYHYGSDYRQQAGDWYTLSYMSQLGGWAMLDYALHFATNPAPYLRLGFGSYLSAWALLNSGTAASNYGFWYPGAGNDGACAGGFEPAPYNTNWLAQPVRRGAWYYGSEQDLSFCGAMKAAATILTDDPIFGRFCYGGDWQQTTNLIRITPRDGLRQRFHALLSGGRVHLQLENDQFSSSQYIDCRDDLSRITLAVESTNPAAHTTRLRFSSSLAGAYRVSDASNTVADINLQAGSEVFINLPFSAGPGARTFTLSRL